MKTILILLTLITSAFADIKFNEFLSPRELGVYKWRLVEAPNKGEVVVFSFTVIEKSKNGKVISNKSFHVASTEKDYSTTIIAPDPDYIRDVPDEARQWCVIAAHKRHFVTGEVTGVINRGEEGWIRITSKDGANKNFHFTTEVMSIEDISKVYKVSKELKEVLRRGVLHLEIEKLP